MKRYHLTIRILTLLTLFLPMLLSAQAQEIHIPEPVPPPAAVREAFKLDPFYQQWIDVGGFPVIASEKVNPYAVKEAAYLIHQILRHRPDILQAFVQHRSRFAIVGYTETITQIPEYNDLQPAFFVDIRNRGLGTSSPYEPASGSEENLLHYPGDPYEGGSVLIHEFSHLVHLVGLKRLDPGFDDRLRGTYEAAMAKGLWKNSYAVVNEGEYWAEGVGAWFHGLHPDDAKLYGGTRKDLETYDPALAALLKEAFGDGNWRYTPVTTRLYQPHLQGFNPQNSPTFQWPPETLALNKAFTSDPKSTGNGQWVNLQPYPPSELPRLQALRHEGDPTTIFIANFGIGDVYVYRVEPDSTEISYGRLYHGHRVGSYKTHVGSLWLLKDENGKAFAAYRAESETGRILILPNADTKIEGPWLWMIAPTQYELLGSEAAASGTDYLAVASDGVVTEQDIATNGAIAGAKVGNKAWTSGKLASTGDNNITEALNTIGLTRRDYIEYHVAYGSIALDAPREQKTVMHVGSDDAVKVWLNGTLVHEHPVDRGADDYQDDFPVTLKQGKNRLLVAVYQGWGGWSGFFGFENNAVYSILPVPVVHVGTDQRPPMYWIDAEAGTFHRLVGDAAENFLPRVKNATSLVLEPKGRKMYWTEDTGGDTGAVKRANVDGSNVQLLTTLQSVPTSIAVHAANGKLYWTNSRGRIQQANLNGQHIQNLIENLKDPGNITVDTIGGKIYWTEGKKRIRRANLNGTSIQNIANDLESIGGLAVSGNKIYWTEITGANSGKLRRANLNGSDFGTLAKLQHAPCCIAVDPVGSKLYWTDADGNIRCSNLNGQNVQNVASSLASAIALVLGSVRNNPAAPVNSSLVSSDAMTLDTTCLLSNYPNPFNPETWIPYQLATGSKVRITIYDTRGTVVRVLKLGYQPMGYYTSRTRAAYWDGRNTLGEPVASGVYFYTLTAGEFTATRKMLIRK